ncbi:MAG TPA: hypothetical protein VFP97_17145 [Chitinophagaceae bacterium]|nr:hypothetical protein [Chitinophagaceae bacterium]
MRVLLLFLIAFCCRSNAQDSIIVIKAGTSFNESVPFMDTYQYPQFVTGKVYFKPGDSGVAKMNYHKFLDEMQFIDLKGDTLNIAHPATIRLIRIDADVFYYDEGYVKLLKDTNGIKLAVKQVLLVTGKDKIGAYGIPNPTSAIDTYGTLIDPRGVYKMVPREDITLKRKTQYYIGDKHNQFVWVTRKNLLRQFSKESRRLNEYFNENRVDLNNKDDLEKLLRFLAGL